MTHRSISIEMFDAPRKGQFTQGTIFTCGYAESYSNEAVYGLVITARCDAAQRKVPIYNFIPVVSLRDWIFKDGADITLKRVIDDAENTLENILEDFKLSLTVLRTTSPDVIVEKLLRPLAAHDRRADTKIQRFQAAQSTISHAESALEAGCREKICDALKKAPKFVDKVVKDLSGNKIMGHYLLRGMPTLSDEESDHVALLREVHHIPNSVVQRMVNGISKIEWHNQLEKLTCCPVFRTDEDYCMPIGRLRSPWIEHLMQNWSLLFSRIGVEDIDAESVRRSLDGLGLEVA